MKFNAGRAEGAWGVAFRQQQGASTTRIRELFTNLFPPAMKGNQ